MHTIINYTVHAHTIINHTVHAHTIINYRYMHYAYIYINSIVVTWK